MSFNKVQQRCVKAALAEVVKNKGDKSARWLAHEMASEVFTLAAKSYPKEIAFVLANSFNKIKGRTEAATTDDQKDALLDAWNELRYEEKKALDDEDSEKEPRLTNYTQISGFILRSAAGDMVETTRGGREEKSDNASVKNYIRFYGRSKDGYKEFRRSLKFTIMAQMARDYNGGTIHGDKMKKEYLDAVKNAEAYFKDLTPREKYELTLLPTPLRETQQMKDAGLDADSVVRKNAEAMAAFDNEGAPEVVEIPEPSDSSEVEEEEEGETEEELNDQIEALKEEKKNANKNRKKDIDLEIAELEERLQSFQDA